MPLELEIIRFSEFVRLGAHERLDLEASREILRQLAGACRKRGIDQALLDLREVHPGPTPMLTPEDVVALVKTFREAGFSKKQRLAVLYTADPHRRAKLFALLSSLYGWNVKATDNFEEALSWLSQGESAQDHKQAGEQEIPVQIKGTSDDRLEAHSREETGKEIKASRPPHRHRPPRRRSR